MRVQRILGAVAAQGVMQALQLLIRLIELPLMVIFWGSSKYGEWILVASAVGFAGLADLGMNRTVRREAMMRASGGDMPGAIRLYRAASTALWMSICATTIVGAGIFGLLMRFGWFDGGAKPLAVAALVLLFQQFVQLRLALDNLPYFIAGEYAKAELLSVVGYALSFIGLILGAYLSSEMDLAAGLSFLGSLIGYLILRRSASKEFFPVFSYAAVQEVAPLVKASMASLSIPLGELLNLQMSRLITGIVLGPQAVATFTAIRTLCRVATQPLLVLARAIEPELSLMSDAVRRQSGERLYVGSCRVAAWVGLLLVIVLDIIGPSLFHQWTRGGVTFDYLVFFLLSLGSVLAGLSGVFLSLTLSVNGHGKFAKIYLTAQAVGAMVLIGVARLWGLAGVAVGLFLIDLFLCYAVIRIANLRLNRVNHLNFSTLFGWPGADIRFLIRGLKG